MQADRGRLAEEKEAVADERRRLQGAQGKWAARIEREREELRAIKAEQEAERKLFETERAKLNLKREQLDEQHRTTVMRIDVSAASAVAPPRRAARAPLFRHNLGAARDPRVRSSPRAPAPSPRRSLPHTQVERTKFEEEKTAWAEQSERRRAAVAASAARVEEQLRSLDAGQRVLDAERSKHEAASAEAARTQQQVELAMQEIRDKTDTIARLGEALDSAEKVRCASPASLPPRRFRSGPLTLAKRKPRSPPSPAVSSVHHYPPTLPPALLPPEQAANLAQQREVIARKDHEIALAQLELSGVRPVPSSPPPPAGRAPREGRGSASAGSFDGSARTAQWAPPPPPTPPPASATRNSGGGAYDGLFSGLLPPGVASLGGGPPHRSSPPQHSSLSAISSAPLSDAPSLEEEMAAAERALRVRSSFISFLRALPFFSFVCSSILLFALQGLTDAFQSQPQPPAPREERAQPSPPAARRLMPPPPSRASARSQPVRGAASSPAGAPPSVRVNRHGSIMIGGASRGGSGGSSSHRQHASPLVALGF